VPTDRPADVPRAADVQTQNQPETNSQKGQAPNASATSPRIVQVAAGTSAIPSEQSGGEELATAEKYLRGNNQGTARDNTEAAQWLWKAVGKGNLAATIALSDLYLRGDGVPKSCDQARLLLVAAARKGKSAAADRLRNLQAFGCQ
jgi:TPR repeat protein